MKKNVLMLVSGSLLLMTAATSCKKSDSSLPPIGGYNSSDDVASSNLKAHWTFDNTLKESISGTAPSSGTSNAFTTGVKGQAVTIGSAMLYPTISALSSANGFGSFTVSAWIYTDNNNTGATSVFALTKSASAQTDWNDDPINMYLETGKNQATYDDTLVLHAAFGSFASGTRVGGDNINDYGVRGTDFQTVLGAKHWVHYVMTYDASASAIDIYANGVLVSNNNFRVRKDASGNPIGAMVSPTPTQVLIGGWPNSSNGFTNSAVQAWQAAYTGQIDEVRVYNKNLTLAEISALMQLEQAGR